MAKGKFVNVLGLFSLVLLIHKGEAATFTVGGSKGWSVPSDNTPVYNQWAEKMRFQTGDSLLFVYAPGSDSVLQVSKEDYNSCTTTSPIAKFTDGHTEFKFNKSGPYYFISGNKDNCQKNEKLVVVVLADRSGSKTSLSPPAPAPSTTTTTSPSPTPSSVSDQQPPVASPPSDMGTPLAPSAESNPPKNGATSLVLSFMGSLGAFVGSSVILAF